MKSQPDDETLIEIRDRFGIGSILRLADDPATRKYAQPLVDKLAAAARRYATQPERIARSVAGLDRDTRRARVCAVPAQGSRARRRALPGRGAGPAGHLARRAGTAGRATWAGSIARPSRPSGRARQPRPPARGRRGHGPGRIGDPRAVPFSDLSRRRPPIPAAVRQAAQEAIAGLTGRPFASSPRTRRRC